MNFLDDPLLLLRIALKALSAVFGGVGVFSLCESLRAPKVWFLAVLMLGIAATMVRFVEERR